MALYFVYADCCLIFLNSGYRAKFIAAIFQIMVVYLSLKSLVPILCFISDRSE